MGLDCEKHGDRRSWKKIIEAWLYKRHSHKQLYIQSLHNDDKYCELEKRYKADRALMEELSINYRELASCYRSMQEAVASIKNIYSELDKKVKKMKLKE